MAVEQAQVAQESYDRCCAGPGFFDSFYGFLLASDPAIRPMFAHTEFEKQNRLLKHALGLLLIYGRRPNPSLLERLAIQHNRQNVNIEPRLYQHFVDSLLTAVRKHDPAFTPEVEAAWRAAVNPGIEYMKSKY